MKQDFLFRSREYICGLRTVGVLVRNGKILIQRDRNGSDYALPGGHVRVGESTEEGLCREYAEETGAKIRCGKLLWIEESFWQWNGTQAHTVAFYYQIELEDGYDIPDTGEFQSHKDNCDVVLGWMPLRRLSEITVYPSFLPEVIGDLDAPPRHFVTHE